MAATGLRQLGAGLAPLHRFRLGLEFAISGHRDVDDMIAHHAAIARTIGEQLALSTAVLAALAAAYECWDGKGWPGELAGEDIPLPSRIAQIAEYAEVANRLGGVAAVRQLARERRGAQFDPRLCDALDAEGDMVLSGLDQVGTWDAVIEAEPTLAVVLYGERLDDALLALANFIDIKSPYFLGHSRAVAELAVEAARRLEMSAAEQRSLFRAGLVHDWGRLGISNAIWDKKGPLGAGERERVRLLPHVTDRMLRQSGALAPLAAIAVQHRERLDGSGYPAGLSGPNVTQPARILAAADAYQAMREPRPHRPAVTAEAAATELRAEVKAGRLRVSRRREGPAGLTPREVEVLILVARGLSNKEIGDRLVISAKTVGNHVEHIYGKIDASNRAAASLFAMRHGLLPEERFPGHQTAR
jgi:HD-GYP domain-containing protein (c-di-GMP phosphodiesterase class II)